MNNQQYIAQKKTFYDGLLRFIENENSTEEDFRVLVNLIQTQNIQGNIHETKLLLKLLSHISSNHYRHPRFIENIEQILAFFEHEIPQIFSNEEIFKLFESNYRILYFLLQRNIISFDESIFELFNIRNQWENYLYFLPQIQPFFNELLRANDDENAHFDEYRRKGENDSYICELIRRDSAEEFIAFLNQRNLSVSTRISHSIFETNSFLMDKTPSLIEYAAFFGSIQIFQYLRMNGAELSSSLWIYAIHGKNAELFHILEENNIRPYGDNFINCFEEAVKCHHNDFANYILNTILNQENENISLLFGFRYYNLYFFPDDFTNQRIYYYLCQYDYYTFLEIYLRTPGLDLNQRLVLI